MAANDGSNEILCCVSIPGMMLTWVTLPIPDPRSSVDDMRRRAAEGRRVREEVVREIEGRGSRLFDVVEAINAELSVPRARRTPRAALRWDQKFAPSPRWEWYGAHEIIAECLGAPEPIWDERSLGWWQNHEQHLAWVQSAADVARIQVPDWKNSAPVAKTLAACERWNRAFPEQPAAASFGGYPSFVDLGIYLLGTRFFTILGGEPDLADALMEKCIELIWSYDEFGRSMRKTPAPKRCDCGGDGMCLLSPLLYEKYGIGFDLRLFAYFRRTHGTPDDLPCNLHSCGPSGHLYDSWSRHPFRKNITTMQTRLLPGQVKRLRECLPDTRLELTLAPPHFDFAAVEPAEVRRVVWESARDAGFRDVSFTLIVAAHQASNVPRIEANLQACYETVTEMNRQQDHSASEGVVA